MNSDGGIKFVGVYDKTREEVFLLFQEDSDYIMPKCPDEQEFEQHLDFFSEDVEKDVNHAIACGAKLAEPQYSEKWRTVINPMVHPFCIENPF